MSQTDQTNPPNFSDVLKLLKRDIFVSMNCVQIGEIQAFDSTDQTASIQISLKQVVDKEADGTKVIKEKPILLKCPVVNLTGGSAYLSMPITKGDTCIVLFNDREIDNWFTSGGIQTPLTERAHDISDGLAIVGIRNLQNAITDYFEGVRLQFDSATKIQFTENLIESFAVLFDHNGSMNVQENLSIQGMTTGNTGTEVWGLDAELVQEAGRSIHAGNGFSGTIGGVTFVDGIAIA